MSDTSVLPDLTGSVAAISAAAALHGALLDSRERWRDLVALASDLAFETDAAGRLVFLSPDRPLGHDAGALLGTDGAALLEGGERAWNPFLPPEPVRGRRVWLRGGDGRMRPFLLNCAPILLGGRVIGARGVAQDASAQEARDASLAATLRRGEVVEHILWQMRQEVLAPRMMQAVLEGVSAAIGADGVAVLDMLAADGQDRVAHGVGAPPGTLLPALAGFLDGDSPDPTVHSGPAGEPVLCCPSYTRFGGRAGLVAWRVSPDRPWDGDDALLLGAVTAIVRVVLEHESIQQELARQARTDPLTGLLNRRSFLEEMHRRIDRLDREGQPGTLMFVDLDNFKQVNDCCGHEAGDEALVLAASLLRATVRPTDLVARLGGDEFAMWMDAADTFTAAERAESLRLGAPHAFAAALPPGAALMSMSIGIATRQPGWDEPMMDVLRRADEAMYLVKHNGRGHWRAALDAGPSTPGPA